MKNIIINKKNSIKLSLILPTIISIILTIAYCFIPNSNEISQQFLKGFLSLIPIFTFILSVFFYWTSIFLSKPLVEKNKITVKINKCIISLITIPIIVCLLFCFMLQKSSNSNFIYYNYALTSFKTIIIFSCFISFIESSIILLSSRTKQGGK